VELRGIEAKGLPGSVGRISYTSLLARTGSPLSKLSVSKPMTVTEPTSLMLPEIWVSRARGGVPSIDLAELTDVPSVAEGEPIRLRGTNYDPVGWGVIDGATGVVWSYPSQPDELFDEAFFRGRIARALAWRERLGLNVAEGGYRLINGEGDGLPGFQVDVYARHVVIYSLSAVLDVHVPMLARVIAGTLEPISIISKVRPTGDVPTGKLAYRLEHGAEPPQALSVRENDLVYEVHLTGGINTGLFLDMRLVRETIRPWLRGKAVLNLFSYTGSFSMLAVREGAKSITSVDFAQGVLDWTKSNLALNEIPLSKHIRFERDDVLEYVKVARRHEKSFDVIILDPPARTTVPNKRWFMKSDYGRLIGHALKILSPGGLLVVAASSVASKPEKLESQIREAAKETGRRLQLVATPGLPADFPTQMIHPSARHLKCLFLLADG
jgi:23S rRNA (cytosine1962-C5)-methyltransferase